VAAQPAQESFDDFYRTTSRRVVHQVYAMTGDLAEAQDCVQEAYARAWQRWGRVGSMADPEAWVRTVARRVAVSRWRRTMTSTRHLLRQRGEPVAPAPSEDHQLIVQALRQIPRAQREAIVLHHLVGLPVAQVAAETGAPEGTVKARLHRGRTALAEIIGPLDAPPDVRPDVHPDVHPDVQGGRP
jgi:RNA polymerase sigma-70 factor (ECF subfamily)